MAARNRSESRSLWRRSLERDPHPRLSDSDELNEGFEAKFFAAPPSTPHRNSFSSFFRHRKSMSVLSASADFPYYHGEPKTATDAGLPSSGRSPSPLSSAKTRWRKHLSLGLTSFARPSADMRERDPAQDSYDQMDASLVAFPALSPNVGKASDTTSDASPMSTSVFDCASSPLPTKLLCSPLHMRAGSRLAMYICDDLFEEEDERSSPFRIDENPFATPAQLNEPPTFSSAYAPRQDRISVSSACASRKDSVSTMSSQTSQSTQATSRKGSQSEVLPQSYGSQNDPSATLRTRHHDFAQSHRSVHAEAQQSAAQLQTMKPVGATSSVTVTPSRLRSQSLDAPLHFRQVQPSPRNSKGSSFYGSSSLKHINSASSMASVTAELPKAFLASSAFTEPEEASATESQELSADEALAASPFPDAIVERQANEHAKSVIWPVSSAEAASATDTDTSLHPAPDTQTGCAVSEKSNADMREPVLVRRRAGTNPFTAATRTEPHSAATDSLHYTERRHKLNEEDPARQLAAVPLPEHGKCAIADEPKPHAMSASTEIYLDAETSIIDGNEIDARSAASCNNMGQETISVPCVEATESHNQQTFQNNPCGASNDQKLFRMVSLSIPASPESAIKSMMSGMTEKSGQILRTPHWCGRDAYPERNVREGRTMRPRLLTRISNQASRSIHVCFVCKSDFTGLKCVTCDCKYVPGPPATLRTDLDVLDMGLIRDLAAQKEYELLEEVLFAAFANMSTIVSTYYSAADASAKGFQPIIRFQQLSELYTTLDGLSSTKPMRAVLKGIMEALMQRAYAPLSLAELAYLFVVLRCPVFVACSMFTKITGPNQKLAKYAALRSRARSLLEYSMGLLANATEKLSDTLVLQISHLDSKKFEQILDLINSYIAHRLMYLFQYRSKRPVPALYPRSCSAEHPEIRHDWYSTDWQIASAVRVLGFFFSANDKAARVPVSAFYNAMVDHIDYRSDCDNWLIGLKSKEQRKFTFCRYPYVMGVDIKTKVLQYSIKQEMIAAAQRQPMFPWRHQNSPDLNLHIKVRRTHLLEDSIKHLGSAEIAFRRKLRVEFVGEPGIDAGGLRKEWLLLFFRQLSDPENGVFVPDDVSNYCWFGSEPNPHYEIAGMALGLALFSSAIVDIPLPRLLFKKLLGYSYTLTDLHQLWPVMAQSLQAVLTYEGDVENDLGLFFTADDGVPLCPGGEYIAVDKNNREQYVKQLAMHMTEASGAFESFKQGFMRVVGVSALSLYRPEELELQICGDQKPLDVAALRSVTKYMHWGRRNKYANSEPVVNWFWEYLTELDIEKQSMLLKFITATDRTPSTGVANMQFRIACLGDDSERLPVAHTCFNQIGLYRYATREKLERKLWTAISESQGFSIQ